MVSIHVSLLSANASLVTTPLNILCDGIELLIRSQERASCCSSGFVVQKKYDNTRCIPTVETVLLRKYVGCILYYDSYDTASYYTCSCTFAPPSLLTVSFEMIFIFVIICDRIREKGPLCTKR